MLSSLPRNILRKTYPQRTLRIIFNQQFSSEPGSGPKGRGPVSWMGLGLAGIAAASAVSYFAVMRERRLEEAMGKVVSSKSGWSPDPDIWARRKFKELNGHWFPEDDPSGPRKSVKPTLCTEDLNI